MEVSEQIIEVLDYLGEKLGFSIDWTSENVLPYVQTLCDKYIRWEIATSITWMIFGLLLMILSYLLYKYAKKFYNKYLETNNEDYQYSVIVLGVFFVIIMIIGVIMTMEQVFDILKCMCFPELQIYEYISNLVKGEI